MDVEKIETFHKLCLPIIATIRGQLRITEKVYSTSSGASQQFPRDFFAFGVLDEVQKAAMGMMQWEEELSDSVASTEDNVSRTCIQELVESQSFRIRRLAEVLIDCICFESTNDEPYFDHYLACLPLDEHLSRQKDYTDFYGKPLDNLNLGIELFRDLVLQAEPGLDFERCWYLEKKSPLDPGRLPSPGRLLSSTRQRLKTALLSANPTERLVLGYSYDGVYGHYSRVVHFNLGIEPLVLINNELASKNAVRVGIMCVAILARLSRILGIAAKTPKMQSSLGEILDRSNAVKIVERMSRLDVFKGDFVDAFGHLGQVKDILEGPYGYCMYRVEYLATRPIRDHAEEWVPPAYLRPVYRIKDMKEFVPKMVKTGELTEEAGRLVTECNPEELGSAIRPVVLELWRIRQATEKEQRSEGKGDNHDPPGTGSDPDGGTSER
ncbi:MAG: hypothetical protein ACYC9Q_09005 [Bacillota bacterium]